MRKKRFIFFDFESTGLGFVEHKIIEWAVKYRNSDKLWITKSEYLQSDVDLTDSAKATTGLTLQFLNENGIDRTQSYRNLLDTMQLDEFTDFSQIVFVGHNILRFDLYHLELICMEIGLNFPMDEICVWDTAAFYKAEKIGLKKVNSETWLQYQNRALDTIRKGLRFNQLYVCDELNIENNEAHSAANDVEAVYQIFLHQANGAYRDAFIDLLNN